MTKKRTRYEEFREKALSDPVVRAAYEEGLDRLRLAISVAASREKAGLTQTQLAARLNTSPSVISRLERGENVELETLDKVARALRARLKIELIPVGRGA
jgi:ribosome-binding protein aMBF1 (putative translation factor)